MASCDIPVTVAPVRPITVEVETCTGSPGTPGTRGSRWFFESSTTPTHNSVPNPQLGDAFLYNNGDLWSYGVNGWAQRGNLTGPQGPSGASDEAIAEWVRDPDSETSDALDEWIGYRFSYVDTSVGDGSADATEAIQAAYDHAASQGGGVVVIPPGHYRTTAPIVMRANTRLLGYGATLHRAGVNGMMMINWEPGDKSTPAYDGPSNITVEGLTLDGHAGDTGWPNEDSPNQPMTFAHCSNVTVRDVRIIRSHTNHALEFNAVDGALAENCLIEGWEPGGSTTREAIQIDCASPGVGAPDNTMAQNITVRNCRVKGFDTLPSFATGIGSHTAVGGRRYYNIHVVGCVIEGAFYAGIRPYNWVDSRVDGNWASAAPGGWASGILCDSTVRTLITGNIVTGHAATASAGSGIKLDKNSSYLTVTQNLIRLAVDGIGGDTDGGASHCLVQGNRIMNTFRYSISIGGSSNSIEGNLLRRTNGASVIRFYLGGSNGNSVTGNQYRPDGDPAATFAVSIASGQSVWVFGNDFAGAAALNSGTINTTGNRI